MVLKVGQSTEVHIDRVDEQIKKTVMCREIRELLCLQIGVW